MITIEKENTREILVYASTESEWDCCNCAYIDLSSDKYREFLVKNNIIATDMKRDIADFIGFSVYDDSAQFSTCGMESGKDFEFVSTGTELGDFLDENKPEQYLEGSNITFFGNGLVKWKAYGKHTGETFYTAVLQIDEILYDETH